MSTAGRICTSAEELREGMLVEYTMLGNRLWGPYRGVLERPTSDVWAVPGAAVGFMADDIAAGRVRILEDAPVAATAPITPADRTPQVGETWWNRSNGRYARVVHEWTGNGPVGYLYLDDGHPGARSLKSFLHHFTLVTPASSVAVEAAAMALCQWCSRPLPQCTCRRAAPPVERPAPACPPPDPKFANCTHCGKALKHNLGAPQSCSIECVSAPTACPPTCNPATPCGRKGCMAMAHLQREAWVATATAAVTSMTGRRR